MDYLYNLYVSFKDGHTQEFEKNSNLSITKIRRETDRQRERKRERVEMMLKSMITTLLLWSFYFSSVGGKMLYS